MAKAHCEDLWSDFWEYADEHFVDEFRVNFHERWFEMYLTVSLHSGGAGGRKPEFWTGHFPGSR